MSIFEKFNQKTNMEDLNAAVKEAQEKGGTGFEDVPLGNYTVKIDKMEIKESSKGDPMFSCWFRILEGKEKNRLIFMNQLITQGFQIHIVNEFLRSLDTGIDVEWPGDYATYNDLILDVHEACEKLEFDIKYGENKGFKTFKVLEVYDA